MTISRLDLIQLPGPAYISQLTSKAINYNAETETGYGSANVHPLFSAVLSQTPTVDFSTTQIATLLRKLRQSVIRTGRHLPLTSDQLVHSRELLHGPLPIGT